MAIAYPMIAYLVLLVVAATGIPGPRPERHACLGHVRGHSCQTFPAHATDAHKQGVACDCHVGEGRASCST